MRVLVGDAFRRRGHFAVSCDFLPTDAPGPHIQGDVLKKPRSGRWENQTPSGQNRLGPSPDRWKIRSVTYPGIAEAMAEQWG